MHSFLKRIALRYFDITMSFCFIPLNMIVRKLAHLRAGAWEKTFRIDRLQLHLVLGDYTHRKIYFRAFERSEVRWVRSVLRQGDVALDIGANVGFFTAHFCNLVGTHGKVIAVEPIEESFRALGETFKGHGNIHLMRFAASNTDGFASITDHHHSKDRSSGFFRVVSGDSPVTESSGVGCAGCSHVESVETRRLDGALRALGVDQLRLIKCDVEGHEFEALLGLGEYLSPDKIDFVLFETFVGGDVATGASRAVLELLGGRGFSIARIASDGSLKDLGDLTRRNSKGSSTVENLVALGSAPIKARD